MFICLKLKIWSISKKIFNVFFQISWLKLVWFDRHQITFVYHCRNLMECGKGISLRFFYKWSDAIDAATKLSFIVYIVTGLGNCFVFKFSTWTVVTFIFDCSFHYFCWCFRLLYYFDFIFHTSSIPFNEMNFQNKCNSVNKAVHWYEMQESLIQKVYLLSCVSNFILAQFRSFR